LTADQLRDLLAKVRASEYCRKHDVVDPIALFIATGVRLSELLALRWSDFDENTGMITVCGKVVRVKGKGLIRSDDTKSEGRPADHPLGRRFADLRVGRAPKTAIPRRATDDLPVHRGPAGRTLATSAPLARVREDLGVPDGDVTLIP